MGLSTLTTVAAILLVGFLLARTYNRVVRSRVRCEEAWSGIEDYAYVVGAEFTQYSSEAWDALQRLVR